MAEFEDKLNAILGDPAAMGQIMALAQSLSGGPKAPAASQSEPVKEENLSDQNTPDLSALLGQMDPAALRMGTRLLREYQGGDSRNAALLAALRPFLREDRRARLDKAIELARMTRLIRAVLSAAGGKEGEEGV